MKVAAADTIRAVQLRNDADNISDDNHSDGQSAFFIVIEFFRETNAEGLRIRSRLEDAIRRAQAEDHAAAIRAFEATAEVIRKEIAEARQRATEVDELRKMDSETTAWYAREFVQVENAWDDLDQLWSHLNAALPENADPAALLELVRIGNESIRTIDALVFTCACQTIPNELDNYLANYRIGTSLDFLATFKDQLPNEESTRAVLAQLAPQCGIVSGLIDLRNAKVIKADHRVWRQALSVLIVSAACGLGFALIAIAIHLGPWLKIADADWILKPQQWRSLNGAYLLVLLGVLGHWILDRIKQNRSGTDVTPFSEWLMWIHVNEVPIVVRIATVWVMIGLGIWAQTFDLAKSLQPVTYFTAGYFMDSTFDALIGRFNTFISNEDPDKKGKKS